MSDILSHFPEICGHSCNNSTMNLYPCMHLRRPIHNIYHTIDLSLGIYKPMLTEWKQAISIP